MKICMFVEGSYPYVQGGVSSWVHQLTTELSEHDFTIISIMPSRDDISEVKYDLPKNIKSLRTIYLNDYLDNNPLKGSKEPSFNDLEREQIIKFFRFESDVMWDVVLKGLSNIKKTGDSVQFFKSEFFWNAILDYYNDNYRKEEFNLFFWTLRSMFIPLFSIIQSEMEEADVFHTVSTGYAGILGLIAKFTYNKPLVLTEHGIYAREREEEIIQAKWVTGIYKKFWIELFYYLSEAVYKNADLVVSLFDGNRQIQLELGSREDNTIVVPNGVDLKGFNIEHLKTGDFNIGAILRVVPIKDVKTLIRAFKLVKSNVEEAKLYIIGPTEEDEDYYTECLRLVDNMGINDDVVFTDKADVKKYLKIMDVLVLTSISEGQPLVILEGMASEVPFVSTDVGGCRELLLGRENESIGPSGIITTPVMPYETFEAIYTLYKDSELREQMSTNGRKRVETYYSKEQFIKKYRQIYDEIGRK